MYQDKLVAAIKVNGRILRENGDTVALPFGCEYSILIKNLNSVRAQVSVSVDGKDATEGTRLVIAANSSMVLERFIRNGNLNAGNKFKFIERTAEIEGHRGVGEDDGLVRVEGWREHVQKFQDVPIPRYYDDWYPAPRPYYPPRPHWPYRGPTWSSNSMNATMGTRRPGATQAKGASTGLRSFTANIGASASAGPSHMTMDSAFNSDAGITVAGSQSSQQFHHTSGFPLESGSTVLILRLRGTVDGEPIIAPVTVAAKAICNTCGKSNKATSQFCDQCGTALTLI